MSIISRMKKIRSIRQVYCLAWVFSGRENGGHVTSACGAGLSCAGNSLSIEIYL